MNLEALLEHLHERAQDPDDGDVTIENSDDGKMVLNLRSIPKGEGNTFRFRIGPDATVFRDQRGTIYGEDEDERQGGDDDDTGDNDVGFKSIGSVEGTASSTSVDWYGTEMTLEALEDMRDQFMSESGVPLLPTHGDWFSVPEWDMVIGQSIEANIRKADVEEPFEEGEQGYILDVVSALYDVPKAVELQQRLDSRQPIGQSIGGWFTGLTVIYNEEGDLERILVLKVDLDHLAVTRMPANPDSHGLHNLRAMLSAPIKKLARTMPKHDAPMDTRAVEPPETNRSGVTDVQPNTETLDTVDQTGQDPDENLAARAEGPPQESDMTPEEIAAIAAEAARAAVTAAMEPMTALLNKMDERLVKVEEGIAARAANADVTDAAAVMDAAGNVETDAERVLRAQISALENRVAHLAMTPNRRGAHGAPVPVVAGGAGAEGEFRSLVNTAKDEQTGLALATVVERHIKTLSEEEGPAPVTGSGSIRNLTNMLCAGLRAAEADGLIRKPVAAWS